MPYVRADGLEIAYEVLGAGPPLVALHGASSSGRVSFAALLPSLAASFTVFLPDARGHGGTRWDAADGFRASWLVDDLAGLADGLGLSTFHLLGYSMGAGTGLGFAIRAPDRVLTLVVAGVSTAPEPRASVTWRLLDPDRIARDEPDWAAEMDRTIDRDQGPGSWRRLLPAIAADLAIGPSPTPAELRAITAPTLVVVGDRDPLVPVDQAAALARQVRDGRLLVVPGCGHEVLSAGPEVVDAALAAFYRSTEPVARRRVDARPEPSG